MKTGGFPTGAVVAGLDGSTTSQQALAWAVSSAKEDHRALVLFNAIALDPTEVTWFSSADEDVDAVMSRVIDDATRRLEALADEVRAKVPGLEVRTSVSTDRAGRALVGASEHASLVVLGSRGRGPLRGLVLGSVSEAVARRASCPVVVVRPHNQGLVRRGVVAGADATAGSPAVLEFAYRHASKHDLALTVVHCAWEGLAVPSGPLGAPPLVVPVTRDRQALARLDLAECMSGLREEFPDVHVRTVVRNQHPGRALIEASREAHLVVVGRHEHGRLDRLVGADVTGSVLEHAATAVAVVPTS